MNDSVLFKYVVFGSSGCGKSALVKRFVAGSFSKEYTRTVGMNFYKKEVQTKIQDENTDYHVQLWDCSGDIQLRALIPSYCRNSDAIIVAFDLTDSASFESAKNQINELEQLRELKQIPELTPIILVGTKSDLSEQIAVSVETINQFNQNNKYHYIATSAKEEKNVENLFIEGLQRVGKRAEAKKQVGLDQKDRDPDTEIKEKKAVDKLISLCNRYEEHLLKESKNPVMLTNKFWLIDKMQRTLLDEEKNNHQKLKAFSQLFSDKNKEILAEHRDPGFVRFMAGVVRILSLVGLVIPRLGSLAFWKSHGEIFNEKANDIVTHIKPK